MNKAVFIFFLLFTATLYSQYNYVVNGGFENYTECPTNYSTPWDIQFERCLWWRCPTEGTSDFFNSCSGDFSNAGIPFNYFGYQNAHNGNGYGGFFAYEYDAPFGFSFYHEYIQGTINPPLEAGQTYQVSFYVNLAEFSHYSASKIGAYLSTDIISNTGYAALSYTPQIINPVNSFIADTLIWQLISGYYTAMGGEKCITIGWWGDSLDFDSLRYQPTFSYIDSYYFIDDVSIIDTTSNILVPNVFTPNNDGVNDFWYPSGYKIDKMEIHIFNRWGELVFIGDENNYTWDGSCGNQDCSNGTYFYVIQAIGLDNKKIQKKGFIQLFG